MSRSYFTEDAKLAYSPWKPWSISECTQMHEILLEKGYFVNCVLRMGCDRKYHDAWHVRRADVPRLIEQLFRQRFTIEVQAEGHGMASINFVYDYNAGDVIAACRRFWKNNNKETMV